MAVDYYVASDRELATFSEFIDELAETPAEFTKRNVALLARDYWGRRAAGKRIRLEVDGLGVVQTVVPAAEPEPATAKPEPAAATSKPEVPSGRTAREVTEGVQQARRQWQDTYGNHQGSRLVSSTPALDQGGAPQVVFDSHGNVKSDGYRGVADAETMAELAALPDYGEPGYGGRRAMRELQQRAAARAAQRQPVVGEQKTQLPAAVNDALSAGEPLNWHELRHRMGHPKPMTP